MFSLMNCLLTGILFADPFSQYIRSGKLDGNYPTQLSQIHNYFKGNTPHFKSLGIDLRFVSLAGGTISQELAFALALTVDYIDLLTEYGRSHEGRRLIYLTITSPKNHKKLEEIKTEHARLSDPAQSESVDISKMPAVLYQGFSIHGNEPSGGNAAPLVAYYLAAGKGKEVEKLLADCKQF